ncbi:ligand-dependent corepressor isoform X1 [Oncorhynchus kisutch]|uniref:Ligand dependent nuclear receptor corepressor n=1 Tax=Oncorhynchus kisutch TaxID=8019 RepID=A0A8C7KS83_ONCKI|nr:ligand-dependent corepressor-like isoform X1 [Oncorhynchus kisutch]
MASLCKRQQCTIERRGFRQELDSWRHKLIHCVGFESILEGLFGPGLVKDITLFQDCEPEVLLDWSFDVNCLFCCLRREKVKEHLVGITPQVLSESEDLKQDTSKINRLEKQAEEFLNAVFYRKADLPSFSDPHIPLVAREIMQRMIRQFAAEYTSKNSYSQDPPHQPQPNGIKDQSRLLPRAASPAPAPPALPGASSPPSPGPGLSPASASAFAPDSGNGAGSNCSGTGAAASAQNPVLSKLLMADQDSPLDLTVKRPDPTETKTEDGVLDLSTKKAHGTVLKNSHSYTLLPTVKGRALRVERSFRDVEDDDMLPRSLQDGLRDSYVSSAPLKPPLAHSLLIKEELLSQKHRLLGQPPALSLASLEAAGLLNHGNKGNHVEPHPLLARDGSPWGSSSGKTHHHQLDSLLRLKQASAILSDLQDLPLFLDNHHHGAFSSKSSSGGGLRHHHGSTKTHHEVVVKREPGGHHSPPVDLKIPQVRGMDLSWDSHASDLYGYGAMVLGAGGHGGVENALSRKLRVILPKQNRRAGSLRGSLGGFLDGAADYWSSDVDQGTSGQPYPTSDPEGDPCSKQPRKKRGRYRQYNSQILEEAIGMVMGGKMSVSKAQNMYGIPHSTLEYKVKERLGTLKNPPKKKLKLTLRMGGQDSAAESETTPTATPREVAPPEAADLNHEQKMKMEFED